MQNPIIKNCTKTTSQILTHNCFFVFFILNSLPILNLMPVTHFKNVCPMATKKHLTIVYVHQQQIKLLVSKLDNIIKRLKCLQSFQQSHQKSTYLNFLNVFLVSISKWKYNYRWYIETPHFQHFSCRLCAIFSWIWGFKLDHQSVSVYFLKYPICS